LWENSFGFTGRLQKVVERERNDRAAFLKKMQMKDGTQGLLLFISFCV
jgi:hypothetical protein